MTCEKFSTGSSFFHRRDPRIKIVVLIIAAWVVATLDTLSFQFLALILSTGMLLLSRLPVREVGLRLLGFNTFCLFIWLTTPFTTSPEGTIAFHLIGPLNVSKAGAMEALEVTLKSNAILCLTLTMLSTSTLTQITHALAHLRVPSSAIQLFYFTWRYFHVISQEAKKIQESMKLRGFRLRSGLHAYKYIGYFFGAIFIKSYDTGINVQMAMKLRGFNGTFWLIEHFEADRADILFLLSSTCTIFTIFWGDHIGHFS